MPHHKNPDNFSRLTPKLLEGKELEEKIEKLQKERNDDYKIILQITNYFQENIRRSRILKRLITYYDMELGGFVYRTYQYYIIKPQDVLEELQKRFMDCFKPENENKNNFFSEIMLDVILESAPLHSIKRKKPSKNNKMGKK